MASAIATHDGNEDRALAIAGLQKELHQVKLQESVIANAIRQKERLKRRRERLVAARGENASKLAEVSNLGVPPLQALMAALPLDGEEGEDLYAELEDLQRKEQYLRAMEEPMWTGPPPWMDASKPWIQASGMQWHYAVDADQKLTVSKREAVSLRILAQPFAHGSSHLAYYTLDSSGNKLVAKRLLYEPASAHSGVKILQAYVHGHTVACRIADTFKLQSSSGNALAETIGFEPVNLAILKSPDLRPPPHDGAKQVVLLLEPWLEGRFQKWVGNDGSITKPEPILEAFAHHSYNISKLEGEAVMVLDLQGVQSQSGRFRLTDPAVTSSSRMYGPTDMGSAAITNFFESHKCSASCPS